MYGYSTDPQAGDGYRRPSLLRLVIIGVAITLAAGFALGSLLWVVGVAFHLAAFLVKVALVTAVAAWAWRRWSHTRSV